MNPTAESVELTVLPSPRRRPETVVTHHRVEDMVGGWFVGDFSPSALRCTGAEVALKHLPAGSSEALHEHRVATEVTVVVSGTIQLAGRRWVSGDVVVLPPHTPTEFSAVTDAVLVVVKAPSVVGDKHTDVQL